MKKLIEKLEKEHSLTLQEYERLILERTPESSEVLRQKALAVRKKIYGNEVYIRGLIEFTNHCRNDCFYCGIRASNKNVRRYRLTKEEILLCSRQGYGLGFRTFVLQGGEDPFFTDEKLCDIIREIKKNHPDCAITLSLGERSKKSYQALFDAGADRYLLRHVRS